MAKPLLILVNGPATETGGTSIPEAIHEAAEEWLARLTGHSDPAAASAFAAWNDADPRHRIAYDRDQA